jgi:glycogen debranching enzyme
MVLALEIFDEKHAIGTLQLADQVLRGPLHMKTLDPEDLQYRDRPAYEDSNDSNYFAIAKGRNYHNVSFFDPA